MKFVAHHLWDRKRASDPNGMRASPMACGRTGCCVAMARTPRTPWSGASRAGAHCTAGKGSRDRSQRSALRLAVRASPRPRQRKSKRAVTRDVLDRLIATCATNRLAHTRDLAIPLLAFASGGRRRS